MWVIRWAELPGRGDGCGRDRVLRRPLHGRDGEDREPDEAGGAAGSRRGLFASRVVPAGQARRLICKQHADKNYYVIAYINCSAGVKALSDVICTSGNAVKIVNARAAGSEHSLRARIRISARG